MNTEYLEKLELLYWLNENEKITYEQYNDLLELTLEEIKQWMEKNS